MRKTRIILMITALLVLLVSVGTGTVYRLFPLRYTEYIERYAAEYNLDKYEVCGVIYAESGFDKKAHSGIARGLMQMTDATADWVAERLEMDYSYDMAEEPEINIKMGCYYLSWLREKYGDGNTALAAYNAGMGNVSKWLCDDRYSHDGKTLYEMPYRETANYVKRVNLFTQIYRRLYSNQIGKKYEKYER